MKINSNDELVEIIGEGFYGLLSEITLKHILNF